MRKAAYIILCVLILSACDKLFLDVEGSDADLQGKWQLTPADTVYFNFQKNLFQYQIYVEKDSLKQVYGYYTLYTNDSIRLELYKNTSQIILDPLGWNPHTTEDGLEIVYKNYYIERINSKKMVLSSSDETLSFKKF